QHAVARAPRVLAEEAAALGDAREARTPARAAALRRADATEAWAKVQGSEPPPRPRAASVAPAARARPQSGPRRAASLSAVWRGDEDVDVLVLREPRHRPRTDHRHPANGRDRRVPARRLDRLRISTSTDRRARKARRHAARRSR